MMDEISLKDMSASQRSSFSNHDAIINNLLESKNLTEI